MRCVQRCFTSACGARRACMLRAPSGMTAHGQSPASSPLASALSLRRSRCPPVARLERVSHTPTAHALLHCSRDVCGSVIASAHPGLAGSGSGASSGGLALALGGDVDGRRASPHVAEGGRPTAALVCIFRRLSSRASHGRSSSPRSSVGLPRPLSSSGLSRPPSAMSSFDCARSVWARQAAVQCAGVQACGATSMRRRQASRRRHRRKTRILEDEAKPRNAARNLQNTGCNGNPKRLPVHNGR